MVVAVEITLCLILFAIQVIIIEFYDKGPEYVIYIVIGCFFNITFLYHFITVYYGYNKYQDKFLENVKHMITEDEKKQFTKKSKEVKLLLLLIIQYLLVFILQIAIELFYY